MELLLVENVTKYFQKEKERVKTLDGVSFSRGKGCTTLLGLNGAGKTTLINVILGLLVPDEGSILVDDTNPVEKPGVAAYPFLPYHDDRATVNDLVGLIEMFFDVHVPERLLKELELDGEFHTEYQRLSTGYKARLRLLSALVQPSKVILLDEMTNGMDVASVDVFFRVVNNVKRNKLVFFSTHIFEHAEKVSDNVLVLHRGRILFDGSRKDFLKQARVLVEIEGENILGGRNEGGKRLFEIEDEERDLPLIIERIIRKGGKIRSIKVRRRGFESAFKTIILGEE